MGKHDDKSDLNDCFKYQEFSNYQHDLLSIFTF